MAKTITLLLQLSLIIPFVMVIVSALIGLRVLKGNPRWPALIGVSLTTIVALTSTLFFRSTIHSQSYSQTLLHWLTLSDHPEVALQIGVLFDPLSLSFFMLISLVSLFYLVLNSTWSVPFASTSHSSSRFTSLLFLMCFFATSGIVLSTNFLQLLFFWFCLSMSMNLLHEVTLNFDTLSEQPRRQWWGWNAFSDGMLLLAVFLIADNFKTVSYLQCLHPSAIQAVHIKNSAALPGIGVVLFFAALPRLGLFPASTLVLSNERPWSSSSLAVLNLLALPAGLFLLLRCSPILQADEANQRLLIQVGSASAFLTMFSAMSLSPRQYGDRFLCWISTTLGGMGVAILGINAPHSLSLVLTMILLDGCVFSVLIPMICLLRANALSAHSLTAFKICYLLLMVAELIGLGSLLDPLILARSMASDTRAELMVWLMILNIAGTTFGFARFYFSLNFKWTSSTSSWKMSLLPLWGISLLISLTGIFLLLSVPFFQQVWPGLTRQGMENPFERDWFLCSVFCMAIILSMVLAWMCAPKTDVSTSTEKPKSAFINLGQSHFYSLRILNQTLINPLHVIAKMMFLLDGWILNRFSRASLEKTPRYWGHILHQMQNGQFAFQTLVLLFTLSILMIVILIL
ncbi:hypothetical protein [Gimesia aquarii]|uniref:NADH:ubiquinone oxidoreductase subunit L n=1 Tax=Gimesia aquarii TaxID=2527964 RepID=A0A517W2V4_9PLAN|nr:hypothetical protein [Gimesia aquarii]QDT99583.1 NADH:ubiquinone oxidoreductase subunit L [Gimesia aquarii]